MAVIALARTLHAARRFACEGGSDSDNVPPGTFIATGCPSCSATTGPWTVRRISKDFSRQLPSACSTRIVSTCVSNWHTCPSRI